MTDIRKPRRGSLAFRPRKRSISENVSISWLDVGREGILGFAGYKVGMTHLKMVDDSNSPTKGKEIVVPASVVEVPPLQVYGVRFYKDGHSFCDVHTDNKNILKALNTRRKSGHTHVGKDAIKDIDSFDFARLLMFTNPSLTSMGKKHIERMEIGLGGSPEKQKELCISLLGNQVKFSDVFKVGEYLDVSAVTKGKGWQGTVKRFGTRIQRRKATGKRRHIGTLGEWHPAYVQYTIPRPGQMGYHSRTEMNKRILFIGSKEDVGKLNNISGFPKYGRVKNDFVLLKGSIPGPTKRLVKMRFAVKGPKEIKEPNVLEIFARG